MYLLHHSESVGTEHGPWHRNAEFDRKIIGLGLQSEAHCIHSGPHRPIVFLGF